MIKRFLRFLFLLILLGGVLFFFVAGKLALRVYNSTGDVNDFEISSHAQSLHQQLLVADLHADNLIWDRSLLNESSAGHVDVPRLIAGNYALQVFDAVIKFPKGANYQANAADSDLITLLAMANRWPPSTWFNLTERALHQASILEKAAYTSSSLEFIQTSDDLRSFLNRRRSNSYIVAGILSLEGLHALEGRYENLEPLINAGYRIMGLVHFFDNEVGGSSAGLKKGGLTELGHQVVQRLERDQIIIDLAHASPTLIDDVLRTTSRPVIVSHTGVKGVYDSPRNLSDAHIRAIAERKGLIGVGFWEGALGDDHPQTIARTARYIADLVGVDPIALGSDFDGAVETSFDSSEIIYVTEALIREGFSDAEIKRIMGENQIRFMLENLPD